MAIFNSYVKLPEGIPIWCFHVATGAISPTLELTATRPWMHHDGLNTSKIFEDLRRSVGDGDNNYFCHITMVIEELVKQPVIFIASQSEHVKNDGLEAVKMGMRQQRRRTDARKIGIEGVIEYNNSSKNIDPAILGCGFVSTWGGTPKWLFQCGQPW